MEIRTPVATQHHVRDAESIHRWLLFNADQLPLSYAGSNSRVVADLAIEFHHSRNEKASRSCARVQYRVVHPDLCDLYEQLRQVTRRQDDAESLPVATRVP